MLGRTFTEYASKLKLDRAYKKAEKMMDTKCQKEKMKKEIMAKDKPKIFERNKDGVM